MVGSDMRATRVLMVVLGLSTMAAGPGSGQEEPELRGTVVSAGNGAVVAGAWIALADRDWGTFSWNDGHFFLPEVPAGPATYEVSAIGYDSKELTLDPKATDQVVTLDPEPEVLAGLRYFMEQLDRRREHGGDLRVFDREALAFNGAFSLGEYLTQRGVRRILSVCLDERPETLGVLGRRGSEFYLAEVVGGYLRLYTEEFVERAARERLELQREPRICGGVVDGT